MTDRVAVIGIGNILMGDDGLGVAVIEALRKESLPESVELYDAGTALQDVLAVIADCERLILIDSCRAGGEPGSIYRTLWCPDDWTGESLGDSLHDIGVIHAIQLHRIAGGEIGEVVLIGVEPQDVSLREGLSPALQECLSAVVRAVRDEIVEACTAIRRSCGEEGAYERNVQEETVRGRLGV